MDHATLSFLRGLAPELTGQMYLRALALTRIASIAPVGRRLLSQQMDLPEREVRSLCDGMREDGLISCSAGGMTLTEKGGALLSEAQETVRYLGGIDELESRLNGELGRQAAACCDYAVLVDPRRGPDIRRGLLEGGFPADRIFLTDTLEKGLDHARRIAGPKMILLLNDLPDHY